MTDALRPMGILVAALGGEGGGVLTNWIVEALRQGGYLVQSTSIPGVAQRTGATTYYVEFCPVPLVELGSRRPVLSLMPMPGGVDLVLSSELLEGARAAQNGFVAPDRTTLVCSSHRILTIGEKSAPSDGRFDAEAARAACRERAKACVLFDMDAAAREAGTVVSAVLLGGLAGTDLLPITAEDLRDVVRAGGRGVEASLRGFEMGMSAVHAGGIPAERGRPAALHGAADLDGWPTELRDLGAHAVARLTDYQDATYADLYLRRMSPIIALDAEQGGADRGWTLAREVARHLALRMSYEDVMRVAQLKSRRDRWEGLRADRADLPMQVTEFFKPGPEEACAILPPALGERLLGALRRRGREHRFHREVHLRSDTVTGLLALRLMAAARRLRRGSWRFAQETAWIEAWLSDVAAAARIDYGTGVEAALSATLVKGYSGTYRRGLAHYEAIRRDVLAPALAAGRPAAEAIAAARGAALSTPTTPPPVVSGATPPTLRAAPLAAE